MKVNRINDLTIYNVRTKEFKRNKNLKTPLINHYVNISVDEDLDLSGKYLIGDDVYTPLSKTVLINVNDEVAKISISIGDEVYLVSTNIAEM